MYEIPVNPREFSQHPVFASHVLKASPQLHLAPEATREKMNGNKIRGMTRAELVAKLATRFPSLTVKDVDISVKAILDALADTLSKRNRVEIRGFGSFMLNYRPARVGRNPKSGVRVQVPAKYVPHFKPGKEMRERVDLP